MNLIIKMLSPEFATQIRQRVVRGAKWLDKERPGWEKKIKVKYLEMSHADQCVLGQVFMGHFDEGSDVLATSAAGKAFTGNNINALAAHYGFDLSNEEAQELGLEEDLAWSYLAENWINAAKKRKARKVVKT